MREQARTSNIENGARTYGPSSKQAWAWACLAILLFSCALDVFFYSGFYSSDDAAYLEAARRILTGQGYPDRPDLAAIRLTIVGWNALVGLIFGFNIPLIAASYIVFHQFLNVLTFMLARRLFDDAVGLLATYLVATTPLVVTFSTTVLPDIPLSCFLVLSLLLFLRSYDRRAGGASRRARWLVFAAGLSVGLAYTTKEAALVALPFYLILWLCLESRQAPRRALVTGSCFALGFFAVFFAEWAILSYLTGHSYFRLAWTVGPENYTGILRGYEHGLYPLERLAWVHTNLYPWFENTRLDYLLAGVALVYVFVPGRKLSIWGLAACYFVYHTWGSARLTEYLPPSLQARYFTPLLPLLFIAYSFIMLKLWRSVPKLVADAGRSRALQAIFLFVLIVHPLPGLHRSDRAAGKVYWADAVNVSVKATQAGLLAGARPVVLSGTVTRRIRSLLKQNPIERLIPADQCRLRSPALARLLDQGFYYVEYYPARRLAGGLKRPDGVDACLHPLILALPDEPEPWSEVQDRVLGRVEIAGRPGVLRRLKRFDCWQKRTQQLAYTITPFAGFHPDFGSYSAYLYEWTPDGRRSTPESDQAAAESPVTHRDVP